MTSKNETTNSPIHEFNVLHKGMTAFSNPFLMVYYLFLIYYFKKILSLAFFILKALKDTLIRELVK